MTNFPIFIISAPIKTLSQIISEGLGLGDKPDYFSVKAITTLIKKDTAVYMVKIFQHTKTSFLDYRCVPKIDVGKKLLMTIMVHIDVKNVTRLIIILNGLIWFR